MSAPCVATPKKPQDKQGITSSEKRSTEDTTQKTKGEDVPSIKYSSSSIPSDLSVGSSRENKAEEKTEQVVDNTVLVTQHYNTLEEKGIAQRNQSRILYMRNFNNWLKSMLLNEYLSKVIQEKVHGTSLKVLDMCCGKGGDLLKWRKKDITHLICADIADVSIEQCQQRYNDMVMKRSHERGFGPIFKAEFIVADCTKVRLREKYKDASIQLDLVSCQFAFHYCFESLPQAECMFRNASECLKPGGYFVGTIPNAYELVSRWQKTEGNKFGNDIYSVEFSSIDKEKPPLFGAKYDFQLEGVVNCPEFLVYPPTLCKLASKFGLDLVMFKGFDSYYEQMKHEGRSLLANIQALETYPPYHAVPLLGKAAQDYQHAVQYMQNVPDHRKIGTLSQSEWDVASLYAAFVFQKTKTTLTSSGKPKSEKL